MILLALCAAVGAWWFGGLFDSAGKTARDLAVVAVLALGGILLVWYSVALAAVENGAASDKGVLSESARAVGGIGSAVAGAIGNFFGAVLGIFVSTKGGK